MDLEEAVALLQILDAPHGADLRRYLRVIALDAVIAEQNDALSIRDQLPLEVGTDVPRAPAEHIHPSFIGVEPVGHDDVGREASLPLCPPQCLFNCSGAPQAGHLGFILSPQGFFTPPA